MPGITARICGICPVSHLIASAKAGDQILAVTIPKAAQKLRRLMNLGQIVQSHALSFFHLSAPDLILGFDSEPSKRNVFGLIEANPELARKGIRLRQFGQEVIELLGGKKIHPSWADPGGVRNALTNEQVLQIKEKLPEAKATAKLAIETFKKLIKPLRREANIFGHFPSLYMGLVAEDGNWEHYDGKIRFVDSMGNIVADDLDPANYKSFIGEAVESWSYLKFPYYFPMGYPDGIYRVGPLARVNVCDAMGTPEADKELKEFRSYADSDDHSLNTAFFYHYARLIEIIASLEQIENYLADPDIVSNKRLKARASINSLKGVAASEAPRGTLFHDYEVDDAGLIQKVNLIIATGQNNLAMNRTIEQIARHFIHLQNDKIPEGMFNRVEAGIRAYDPCLSCSTHAFGKMPMEITLTDKSGNIIDRKCR
jgi:NAD-reducing hydrogenase large subunit